MSETLELVRFTVDRERRDEFIALRPEAIRAVREHFSGMIDSRLAEQDDGSYVDVVRWRSRDEALRAAEGCMEIPAVKAWIDTIASVTDMSHATVLDAA